MYNLEVNNHYINDLVPGNDIKIYLNENVLWKISGNTKLVIDPLASNPYVTNN